MSLSYGEAALKNGADYGGGILLWHIDDNTYERYIGNNTVNDIDHHLAIVPLFKETKSGKSTLMGTTVSRENPFFSSDCWDGPLYLPMYGDKDNDVPGDRTPAVNLILSLDSNNAPVMNMHRHVIESPNYTVSDDQSTITASGTCPICNENIPLETTKVVTSKIVKEPEKENTKLKYE